MSPRILVESERSLAGGIAASIAALGLAGLTVAFAVDPGISPLGRAVTGSMGALLTLTVGFSAWRLTSRRGGLFLDEMGRRLGLGITGPDDVWWIDLDRITGVRILRTEPPGDTVVFLWRARLELRGGVGIAVAESSSRELVETVVGRLCEVTALPALEDDTVTEVPAAAPSGSLELRVRRGVAMHGMLSLLGASSTAVGTALYTQVATAPVFAFLFAPVLMALGLALLGSVLVKRLCREELVHKGGLWTHRFAFGERWRWAERQITAPEPSWTLRVLPLRGARLELDGPDAGIILGNGATTRSDASVEDLVRTPERLRPPG